ncbi:tRNA lysidine(34) synthetase TilS [Phenylobacterium sp.]|uniref:tRNA lysidine(34) synthetase TilS n=1 Tax=Phenylobacterium sp. TaxID=1871053 RepID=UPI00286D4B49|nr:tRNA lysidine(34) synthetase TilS [Phenylobacterium sp.]
MRLGPRHTVATPDLEQTVGAILDRRLLRDRAAPIAVAFSGGGDSLALLLTASAWAAAAGRRLLVLTVAHRLNPASAGWTRDCAAVAARLGARFNALAWEGRKPAAGLPAAARSARHALLADTAREAGARAILMGHTADDIAEARRMRATGSTTPEPREWAPSPAWPQGREVFLLRPLLTVRRQQIRAWLHARGESWIEDPANADLTYARSRARKALAGGATDDALVSISPEDGVEIRVLAGSCRADGATGDLLVPRLAFREATADARRRLVSIACLCAGGNDRPPRGRQIDHVAARLLADASFIATLAGARIEADPHQVRIRREPGEVARGGLAPLRLAAGATGVWDGRFEVSAQRAIEVVARPGATLPAVVREDGGFDDLDARPLAHDRLLAACGRIACEPV